MPKKRKTKEEKVKSGYRLENFKLHVAESAARRDTQEFAYLSKDYVKKDLTKTVVFSLVIVSLLLFAKKYLG